MSRRSDHHEGPVVVDIAESTVRARVDRRCDGCGHPIRSGDNYLRRVFIVDGGIEALRMHPGCELHPSVSSCPDCHREPVSP